MLILAVKNCCKVLFLSLFLISSIVAATADEMKPEQIIAKHLDSIGSKEKRDAIKNRMAIGTSDFESKLPSRKTSGKSIIVSELKDLMILSSFASGEYPYEKIGYFKGSVNIPLAWLSSRSPLGTFVADHSVLLTEGLLTGSISSVWRLLDPQFEKGRIESVGTKKVNGRNAYVLRYYPKTNSGDFSVKMYFDAETFHHLRTEYRDAVPGAAPSFGVLGDQFGAVVQLTEDFGDFKKTDNLTFPHTYKIAYTLNSNRGTYEMEWNFKIEQYRFNEKLKENFFSFS